MEGGRLKDTSVIKGRVTVRQNIAERHDQVCLRDSRRVFRSVLTHLADGITSNFQLALDCRLQEDIYQISLSWNVCNERCYMS